MFLKLSIVSKSTSIWRFPVTLWERLTLTILEHLAAKLEICLVDYQHGGFLPPEKRAFPISKQAKVSKLAKKAAALKVLDRKPALRENSHSGWSLRRNSNDTPGPSEIK